jgi:methionine-rich copper-binding protein CopC
MIKKTILFASAAFLVACGSNSTEKSEGTEAVVDTAKKEVVTQPTNELADFKFRTLVINIPSPFEIISLLQKSGTAYKADLANATDNAKKYTTTTKKGLNYGVYIVDLVYLSSNDHFSEVKNYFTTSAGIAKSLEFSDSFEHIVGSRFENNIDKKDSINVFTLQRPTSYCHSNIGR